MDRRDFMRMIGSAAALGVAPLGSAPARAALPTRIRVAAVGDCIPSRRISARRDAGLFELVELLRGADCTWGNCETVLRDAGCGHPAPKGLDPHTWCEPWGADELAWLGIDTVGTANNHALDFGVDGLASTLEHLDRVGIVAAGSGVDLARAARPAFVDGAAGRIGQVNCASSFPDYFAASSAHPYLPGRPGINPLRVERAVQVDPDLHARLAALLRPSLARQGWGDAEELLDGYLAGLPPGATVFGDQVVVVPGDGFDLLGEASAQDVDRITAAVTAAKNGSRLALATLHAHEARDQLERSDLFIEPFARATIDAGADCFFAAGPHVLRGIEIHRGKPIFYGLGNFLFQTGTFAALPAELWSARGLPADSLDVTEFARRSPYAGRRQFWQSVVPVLTFEERLEPEGRRLDLVEAVLHPIQLGADLPLDRRGTPERARGAEALEILERLDWLSAPYGTAIEIDASGGDAVGRLVLSPPGG